MKNILIFARELIPYCNSVGSSIRVVTMANYLVQSGNHVELLAAKGTEVSYFGMNNEIMSLNRIYLDDRLQRFYTQKAKTLLDNSHQLSYISIIDKLKILFKTFINFFAIPDIAIFFLPKFILKALAIIRDKKIDVLLISSPPHSSQILGLIVKYFFVKNIYLVVDYRDGWNTFSLFRSKNPFKCWIDKTIEKNILLISDLFIYQSPTVIKQINDEYFQGNELLSGKSILVRNGYTNLNSSNLFQENIIASRSKGENFVIGYFGGIDFTKQCYRNPIKLLKLLDNCKFKCELVIYGNVSGYDSLESFRNLKISYKGQVSLNKAKEVMRTCDGLLVFHAVKNGGEEVIPGKFYEYIDACKPILVYGPVGMECGLMVQQMGIGSFVSVNESPQDIKKLDEFVEGSQLDTYIKNLELNRAEFSRDVQYAKLAAALERI